MVGATARASVRGEQAIVASLLFAVAAGVAGVAAGLVMAFHRREVGCPDGTVAPEGTTDFRCFSYPHAAQGVAVVAGSVLLIVLIVLVTVLIKRLELSAPPNTADTEPVPDPLSR